MNKHKKSSTQKVKTCREWKKVGRVNLHAMKSITAVNKNRYSRYFHRSLYRLATKRYCNSKNWREMLQLHEENPRMVDPYPWPLCHPDFANWDENDEEESYSLVSDPSGMVVKYATSYCACMIYGYTGKWIRYNANARDANNWVSVLRANGFSKIVTTPEYGYHYIGILRDETADHGHGLVVWLERRTGSLIEYSTYQDHTYRVSQDRAKRFIWIQIA